MKKNKLMIAISAAVLIGIVLLLAYKSQNQEASDDVIRIGAILPLTGLAADMGHDCQKGIQICVDYINQQGGILGRKIVVTFEDSKGTVKDGILCYQKLKTDNVDFIICGLSNISLAIIPMAERDNKMVISTIAVAHNFPSASRNLFRVFLSADTEVRTVADFMAKELRCRNVSMLRMDGDSGSDYSMLIKHNLLPFGTKIVAEEIFDNQTHDFSNSLAKLLNVQSDAIYVFCNDKRLGTISRSILSKRIDLPIITTSAIVENKNVFSQLLDVNNPFEIYYPDLKLDKSCYNSDISPTVCTVFGYDTIVLLSEAFKKANSIEVNRVIESFLQLHNVKGSVGTINVTPNGDITFPLQMKKVEKPSKNF